MSNNVGSSWGRASSWPQILGSREREEVLIRSQAGLLFTGSAGSRAEVLTPVSTGSSSLASFFSESKNPGPFVSMGFSRGDFLVPRSSGDHPLLPASPEVRSLTDSSRTSSSPAVVPESDHLASFSVSREQNRDPLPPASPDVRSFTDSSRTSETPVTVPPAEQLGPTSESRENNGDSAFPEVRSFPDSSEGNHWPVTARASRSEPLEQNLEESVYQVVRIAGLITEVLRRRVPEPPLVPVNNFVANAFNPETFWSPLEVKLAGVTFVVLLVVLGTCVGLVVADLKSDENIKELMGIALGTVGGVCLVGIIWSAYYLIKSYRSFNQNRVRQLPIAQENLL